MNYAAAVLAGICLFAAPSRAEKEKASVIFGNPDVKVFALSLPFGTKDDAEASRRDAAGKTYFKSLYEWFTKDGRTGEGVLVHGPLEDFKSRVDGNLAAHARAKGARLREIVVVLKGHGGLDVVGSQSDGYTISWDAVRDALVGVRSRMDAIDPKSQLVVVVDACHSGQLWNRLKASGKMHHAAFLGAAPADEVGSTEFAGALLSVLQRAEDARRGRQDMGPATWRVIYEALSHHYGGWLKDGDEIHWTAAMYADTNGASLWNPRPSRTPAAKEIPKTEAGASCAGCADGSCPGGRE